MRTFFDIVLGILFTVVKACLHALVSTAGVLAFGAAVIFILVYARRRRYARAKAATVISIDR
jgi:hypothetical protein